MAARARFAALLATWLLQPTIGAALESPQLPPDSAVRRFIDDHVEVGGVDHVVLGLLDATGETRVLSTGSDGSAPYRIGALVHVLTGALLADMVRAGDVALGERIRMHVPGPLRHLGYGGRPVPLAELALHHPGPRHRAGAPLGADTYPDFGVGMLGQLLAARLGDTLDEALRRRVFDPLLMTDTGPAPDGRLVSNAHDLLRFLAARFEGASGTHDPMSELGWFVEVGAAGRTVWHASADGEHRAYLGFDPDRGVGVVVLAAGGPDVAELGRRILTPAASERSRRSDK